MPNTIPYISYVCAQFQQIWDKGLRFACGLLLFFGMHIGYAQVVKNYPNTIIQQSHVDDANYALGSANYATLNSYEGIKIEVLGAEVIIEPPYTGKLEVEYTTPLPAGTTTYVKIDFEDDILNSLLGGNLGGALANLLGTVVLGNHYFNVEARNGGATIISGSSNSGFSDDKMRLIVNESGEYLIAITPNIAYNRIYIEDVTNAIVGLGNTNSMEVHEVFYYSGTDLCNNAFATSFTGTGGTIDALGLASAGVENPQHVIDNNMTNHSELSLGLLTLAGTISQTVYLKTPALSTDQFHIEMQLPDASLLSLGIADGIKVEALLGDSVVYTATDLALLNTDILNLLQLGQVTKVPFSPNTSFDRVRITLSSLVQLNLAKSVYLYGVYVSPAAPTPHVNATQICYNKTYTLSATTDPAHQLLWYDDSDNLLATTPHNGSYNTGNLQADTTIYVAVKKTGCSQASEKVPIEIEVLPDIKHPDITISSLND